MAALGVSWSDRKGTKRGAAAGLAVAAVAALSLTAAPTQHALQAASGMVPVIVTAAPGHGGSPAAAVRAVGGHVNLQLGSDGNVAADVPANRVAALRASAGVAGVADDHKGVLDGRPVAVSSGAVTTPQVLAQATGADAYWRNGFYGQGVGVAVLDSGVVPVDGLRYRLYNGPDFTPESQNAALAHLDGFGHGTFMAGLIAGARDGAQPPYVNDPNVVGMAPQATIVNVKVADALGNTQESSVIAGIDWVIQHKDDPGLNIRVLNLSLSVPNTGYLFSPLAAAVERAWAAGIVVVAAGGNDGANQLTLPAADPWIIAVGAADTNGTPQSADDLIAPFSDSGGWSAAQRHPDLVAPGTHLESLRDPGSYIDQTYGATATTAGGLFLGSGTSEATAVTSGAAALVLSANPGLTPDEVKDVLVRHTAPMRSWPKAFAGHGELSLNGTLGVHPVGLGALTPNLQHAIGWDQPSGDYSGGSWSGSTWSGSTWSGSTWSGSTWSGSTWSGSTWSGSTWSGSTWSGSTWSGSTWSGSTWSGDAWSSANWS